MCVVAVFMILVCVATKSPLSAYKQGALCYYVSLQYMCGSSDARDLPLAR